MYLETTHYLSYLPEISSVSVLKAALCKKTKNRSQMQQAYRRNHPDRVLYQVFKSEVRVDWDFVVKNVLRKLERSQSEIVWPQCLESRWMNRGTKPRELFSRGRASRAATHQKHWIQKHKENESVGKEISVFWVLWWFLHVVKEHLNFSYLNK